MKWQSTLLHDLPLGTESQMLFELENSSRDTSNFSNSETLLKMFKNFPSRSWE